MENKTVCPQTFLSKIPWHLQEMVWIPVTAQVEIPLEMNSYHFSLYEHSLHVSLLYTYHKGIREFLPENRELGWFFYFFLLLCFIKLGIHTYTYIYLSHLEKAQMEPMLAHFWQRDKLELGITFGISNWPGVMKWTWWKAPWLFLLVNILPTTSPALFSQTVSLGSLSLPFICLLTPLHTRFLLQHRKSSHLKFQKTSL